MPGPVRAKIQGVSSPELGAFLLILAAWAVAVPWSTSFQRPGFLTYDEEHQLAMIQRLLDGAPFIWRPTGGCIHNAILYFLSELFGPSVALLRLPSLVAVLLEPLLLWVWLRPRFGDRVALWAGLSDLVCSATFGRAVSMTAVAWLPSLFLLHALCLERVLRRPWQAALWGLSLAVWCFDYEGWAGAALVLGLWAVWAFRRDKGMLGGVVLGSAAGITLLWLSQGGFNAYVSSRVGISIRNASWWSHALPNLTALLTRGDRMPISAAPFHPYPAPWVWLPALGGAWACLKRDPRLAWLMGLGLLPLFLFQTDAEPHRLILFHLGLAACAGMGMAWLWRRRGGPWMAIALLGLGLWQESSAWKNLSSERVNRMYGRSLGLGQAARWLKENPVPGGWQVITGLGSHTDLDFEFLLDAEGVPRKGAQPVALVERDYAPGLKGLDARLLRFPGALDHEILLAFPEPPSAAELRAIREELLWLHQASLVKNVREMQADLAQALRQGRPKSPWARTVAWEAWMYSNTQLDSLDPELFHQALQEPLVSGWFYDIAAERMSTKFPKLSARLRARADELDPRRKHMQYRFLRD